MMMIPKRKNEFDLFDDMFNDSFLMSGNSSRLMKTDIKEKDKEYVIEMDLPGYEKENIKINIADGYLTIHAVSSKNSSEKEEGKFVRKERYLGECSRSFYIGDDVNEDNIKASFKNGILKVEIPKKEAVEELPETKYIEIED